MPRRRWIAGKVTVNPDGSIIVHEDLAVMAERMVASHETAVSAPQEQLKLV